MTTPQTLKAGPLTLLYDDGTIRQIKLNGVPVMHQIYAAIRDHNWNTVPGEMQDLKIDARDDAFDISYSMHHKEGEIDFAWASQISGAPDGTITFSFDGTANSDCRRNRIGFCVLYPMEVAGLACTIEHVDGSTKAGHFPDLIAPHQPFFNIRAVSHEVMPGVTARVLMEGDTFEMEDQRNWTDASYKTYCTPLDLPFPAQVNEGDRIQQKITLSISGDVPAASTEAAPLEITPSDETHPIPPIGLALPTHGEMPTQAEIVKLQALNLAHLRGEVRTDADDRAAQLQFALDYANTLDLPLELAVFVTDAAESELIWLAGQLIDANLARIAVFHTDHKSTPRAIVEIAQKQLANLSTPVGAGTDAFFTELNRDRPAADIADFVIYSVNPQVHAFDNLSLTEALRAHVPTVETAKSFSEDKPVVVSPVSLKMRWNPNATGEAPPTPDGELPERVDQRQATLFGAGWTMGNIKYLAQSGTSAITYYETTGWYGVMETEAGTPLPEQFPSTAGAVFPMWHVFHMVGEYADGGKVVACESSAPLTVDALWLRGTDRDGVIIANFTASQQTVTVHRVAHPAQALALDDTTMEKAITDPLNLWMTPQSVEPEDGSIRITIKPHAVAFLSIRS